MYIYSAAFHTSYQYALAYVFPDIMWTFEGPWSENRPLPPNVSLKKQRAFEDYDFYLAHGPLEFSKLSGQLEERGIPRERVIYIAHWALQPDIWLHLYDGVPYEQFLKDLSNSAIVCVSHFMAPQFRFYSNVCVQAIPHFVPDHVFGEPNWQPGGREFINVVNKFYLPNRGVGAKFWDSLDFVDKKLYGAGNGENGSGPLNTVADFRHAVATAAGYLWTANAVAISFAPLEAMILGCPVIAPANLDWPMFFDDKVNILLYDEGNYESCKQAVEYLNRDKLVAKDLAQRGREAILQMNSATLFRERWSRVIDAARVASIRGRRRLASEASAPISTATTVRNLEASDRQYALTTSMLIGKTRVSISHPAETWNIPRQFIRKYASLRHYNPAKHDLALSASRKDSLIFDVGRDLGFFGYLCAGNDANVRFFNRSSKMNCYIFDTVKYNEIARAHVVDTVFDDEKRDVWLSPNHHVTRGLAATGRTEKSETISIDRYIEAHPDQIPSVIIIDDPAYETRIIRGATRTLEAHKPELIIHCYRHGAYANGAPTLDLLRMLNTFGYSIETCDWNGDPEDLQRLKEISEPAHDVFLLHAKFQHDNEKLS